MSNLVEFVNDKKCILICESGLKGGSVRGGFINIRSVNSKNLCIQEHI